MDNLKDPREINSDDDLNKLTDDESWVFEVDKVQKREEEELRQLKVRWKAIMNEKKNIEARMREIADNKKKAMHKNEVVEPLNQIDKTPSPEKSTRQSLDMESMRTRNLRAQLEKESNGNTSLGNDDEISLAKTDQPKSKLYFAKLLAETKLQDENKNIEMKKFMSSRVYTFDSSMQCEPFPVDEKEHFSGKMINKRYLTKEKLEHFLEHKKVLRLGKLYAKVQPPSYSEPQYPNWLVIGILSKKGTPRTTSNNKSKFLSMTLTDFKFSIDIKLFGKSVEKYNKLRTGDIIAVLNPEVWKWNNDEHGNFRSFSLSIKHDGDSILEIARSKYFGLCQVLKKDGNICGAPIDKSIEECCNFHNELRLRKTASKRLEFSSNISMRSPTKNGRKQQVLLGAPDTSGGTSGMMIDDRSAPKHDRITKAMHHFSSSEAGKAFFNDNFENLEVIKNNQMKKKRLQNREKEEELRLKLSAFTGGQSLKRNRDADNWDSEVLENKKALFKTAFPSKALNSIGYDPTATPLRTGFQAIAEDRRVDSSEIVELKSLIQRKTVDLKPAPEEIKRKRAIQKQTMETLKRIRLKDEQRARSLDSTQRSSPINSESESESDLEIDGTDDKSRDLAHMMKTALQGKSHI